MGILGHFYGGFTSCVSRGRPCGPRNWRLTPGESIIYGGAVPLVRGKAEPHTGGKYNLPHVYATSTPLLWGVFYLLIADIAARADGRRAKRASHGE